MAGVVGPGHPAVRATTTFPGTMEQYRNAAEDNIVGEPDLPAALLTKIQSSPVELLHYLYVMGLS